MKKSKKIEKQIMKALKDNQDKWMNLLFHGSKYDSGHVYIQIKEMVEVIGSALEEYDVKPASTFTANICNLYKKEKT